MTDTGSIRCQERVGLLLRCWIEGGRLMQGRTMCLGTRSGESDVGWRLFSRAQGWTWRLAHLGVKVSVGACGVTFLDLGISSLTRSPRHHLVLVSCSCGSDFLPHFSCAVIARGESCLLYAMFCCLHQCLHLPYQCNTRL